MKNQYKKVTTLQSKISAYIAGIVDGEGTITLTYKQKRAQRHLTLEISNTDKHLLQWIQQQIGAGKIVSKAAHNIKHAEGYAYVIYSKQALDLLKQITPYLRTYKRKRATLALKAYINVTPRNGKYSSDILAKRDKFVRTFFSIGGSTKNLVSFTK